MAKSMQKNITQAGMSWTLCVALVSALTPTAGCGFQGSGSETKSSEGGSTVSMNEVEVWQPSFSDNSLVGIPTGIFLNEAFKDKTVAQYDPRADGETWDSAAQLNQAVSFATSEASRAVNECMAQGRDKLYDTLCQHPELPLTVLGKLAVAPRSTWIDIFKNEKVFDRFLPLSEDLSHAFHTYLATHLALEHSAALQGRRNRDNFFSKLKRSGGYVVANVPAWVPATAVGGTATSILLTKGLSGMDLAGASAIASRINAAFAPVCSLDPMPVASPVDMRAFADNPTAPLVTLYQALLQESANPAYLKTLFNGAAFASMLADLDINTDVSLSAWELAILGAAVVAAAVLLIGPAVVWAVIVAAVKVIALAITAIIALVAGALSLKEAAWQMSQNGLPEDQIAEKALELANDPAVQEAGLTSDQVEMIIGQTFTNLNERYGHTPTS